MPDKTNIFNIPANYHFFKSLFFWMEKTFGAQISELKIFLPNHRSCRELRQIFLQKKSAMILPQIKAISDISIEDFFEIASNQETQEIVAEILQIKVLDGIESLFFLSEEIQKLSVFGKLTSEQSFKIAIHLKNLFDEIEREEIDLKKLTEVDDSNLSKHRQLTLEFLRNFHITIKNSLLKKNILLASSYQNFITQKFSELISKNNLKSPIIIAGSTGSVASSRKLIKEVLGQKNGFAVLFGLKEEEFEEENHPQFFLNQLVSFLEIEKKLIKNIAEKEFILSNESRQQLLSLMTLPSHKTASWQEAKNSLNIEISPHLIEAKDQFEEAKIIAIILKKNFLNNKSAALISNNKKLLKLVKLELHRLDLPFNDARNLGIFDSKLVNFLLLILELIESDFSSSALLTLLKNPLCFASKNPEIISAFEKNILRQDRAQLGLSGIEAKLKNLGDQNLSKFFADFCKKISLQSGANLSLQVQFLIEVAQNLSQKTWQELLEEESAQIELFEFFEKIKSQTEFALNQKSLSKEFKTLLSQISFFEKSDSNAAIQLLSTIEARLLNFDLVIIASLNEGDFPENETENWLGRKIKKDLGIDRSLKKLGQSAYDFCNYLSNPSFILTRSISGDGSAILLESPFLLKFKTICQKLGVKLQSGEEFFLELKNLNNISPKKIQKINPKPESKFRPKKISITEISKLISDPYSIYAKKILQLKELQKIDFEPSYAEFGSFVHKALEEFVKNPEEKNFLEKSRKIFEKFFLFEDAILSWWPKFENIFFDFLEKNKELANCQNYLEVPVKLQLGEVMLSGKIDRVTCDSSGQIDIFDYKTGQLPATKDVICGLEPQLTIAALMLLEGIIDAEMKNVKIDDLSSINYWKISSTKEGEIKKICAKNEELKILISAAKSGLEQLLAYFNDEENGYVATQKNKEYRHLSRANLARNESF